MVLCRRGRDSADPHPPFPLEDRRVRTVRKVLLSAATVALTVVAITTLSAGQATAAPRSSDNLAQLMARLDTGIPGTAWGIDPAANQVVITIDSSVRGASFAQLESAVWGTKGAASTAARSGSTCAAVARTRS